MCGCRVLNADKSANRTLAVVLRCSRCLCTVSMMSVLASSTPLLEWFTNWRGSINRSFTVIMSFFMNLSIALIMREVRATGLRSFIALTELFLAMGTTLECFHSWATVQLSMHLWNRSWNTPPSCSAQHHHDHWCCLGQVLWCPWSSWRLSPPPPCWRKFQLLQAWGKFSQILKKRNWGRWGGMLGCCWPPSLSCGGIGSEPAKELTWIFKCKTMKSTTLRANWSSARATTWKRLSLIPL